MPRAGWADDDPLPIEILGDEGDAGTDVSFGRPARPGRRGVLLVVGAVGIGAILGAAIGLGRRNDNHRAVPPSTTIARAASTIPATTPSTTGGHPNTTTVAAAATTGPPPSAAPFVPPPGLEQDPGWSVWLIRPDGSPAVLKVNPTTGANAVAQQQGSYAKVVTNGPGGPPQFVTAEDAPGVVGDGTVWVAETDSLTRRKLDTREQVERIPGGDIAGLGLQGVTALGRPVVVLADLRSYEVDTEGHLKPFGNGLVGSLDEGQYEDTVCTAAGVCTQEFSGRLGTLAVPIPRGQRSLGATSFAPDGGWAAALYSPGGTSFQHTVLKFFDLRGGQTDAALEVDETTNYGPTAGAWSPDSRYFFFGDGGVLKVFDSTTASVSTYDLAVGAFLQVIGVG